MRREGRVVRGPLVVTRDQFNRRRTKKGRAGGIGFVTTEPQSLRETLCVKYGYGPMIQIPREDEVRHILFTGTTASGKTTAIEQVIMRARDAGETAIIHDPTLEYVTRFYNPKREDIILDPLDERSPYWSPGEEVQYEAEALTIAHAFFPDHPGELSLLEQRTKAPCALAAFPSDVRAVGGVDVGPEQRRCAGERNSVRVDHRADRSGAAWGRAGNDE